MYASKFSRVAAGGENERTVQRVAMMPARFLRLWEVPVLETDIQDLNQESQNGNRYMLVVVDRANKFLCTLPSESAVGVKGKRLEVLLTFGCHYQAGAMRGGDS